MVGISAATMRNWVKAGHISSAKHHPLFMKNDVLELKNNLANGELQKLTHRANKTSSKENVLPVQFSNIQKIIALVNQQNLDLNAVLFVAVIKLLIYENEVSLSHLGNFFQVDLFGNWQRQALKIEIEHWQKELNVFEHNHYVAIYDLIVITNDNDFLGLLYQCLSNEGSKSNKGSYYTPSKLVENSLREITHFANDTFLDPCCGAGKYLIQAAKILKLKPENIIGFDIDALAVKITRINLLLAYKEIEFSPRIYCLDALNELATGEIFCETNNLINAIDIVATNPPWGASKNNSTETFSLFLLKSLSLLKEGGQLSFILPESILNVKTHSTIRHTLLTQGKILKITKLGRQFPGVFTPVIRLDFVKKSKNCEGLVTIQNDKTVFYIEQNRFLANSNYIFDIDVSADEAELLQKIYAIPHQTLFQHAEWALGIVTGDNKKHLSEIQNENAEPILRGADIEAFRVNEAKLFVHFEPKNFQQIAPERFFRMPEKLIYRFISKILAFAYDDKQRLTLNSANILIPKIPNLSLKVTLAYLNSSVFQYLFKKQFSTHKVLRGDLEKLPFPILNTAQHDEIEIMVESVLNDNCRCKELDALIFSTFNLTNTEITTIKMGLKT